MPGGAVAGHREDLVRGLRDSAPLRAARHRHLEDAAVPAVGNIEVTGAVDGKSGDAVELGRGHGGAVGGVAKGRLAEHGVDVTGGHRLAPLAVSRRRDLADDPVVMVSDVEVAAESKARAIGAASFELVAAAPSPEKPDVPDALPAIV